MQDAQARQETQLHRLPRHGKGAGYDRLARDHRRQCRQDHQRQPRPFGSQQEERILRSRRLIQQQRSLPQIVEHQARQRRVKPGDADRLAPEMPHIGIERLRPRHGQHHRSQSQKCQFRIDQEEVQRPPRIDDGEDLRVPHYVGDTQDREHQEIDHHDRAEQRADSRRADALDNEQGDQDDDRDRQHQRGQPRFDHGQPLNGGQHRNGRGDNGVAIE